MGSEIILTGDHPIHPKLQPIYRIDVTNKTVTCRPKLNQETIEENGILVIDLQDIIGCDCLKGKDTDDLNGYLALYSYPLRRKLASKKCVRKREVVTITFSENNSYEANIQVAAHWKSVISRILDNIKLSPSVNQTISPIPKKLLVLINPFSGPGKALQIFQERVVPIFAETGLHFSMVVTERAGHAREICRNMKLDAWYGVVIVSGDGLIYEVINGLMERPDWEKARHMPIGAIPGGSGNALCCTLCFHAGETFVSNFVLHSAFVIAKHEIRPMDLVAVDTCRERIYSFLSITWGIIADVDIESEKYRSLGNARFTIGVVARILGLRKYRGRLSFLPVEPYNPAQRTSHSLSVSEHLSEHGQPGPVRSQSMIIVPADRIDLSQSTPSVNGGEEERAGVVQDTASVQSPQDLERLNPWTLGGEEGSQQPRNGLNHNDGRNGLNHNDGRNGLNHTDGVQLNVHSLMNGVNGLSVGNRGSSEHADRNDLSTTTTSTTTPPPVVPTPILPKYTEPVPNDWVTIEDDFISVAAAYQSYLSPDFLAAPDSKFDDGLIYLTFIRAPMSRGRLTQLFLSMENGSYLQYEGQEAIKVKAFRLEPLENCGTICVDGEKVDYGPIQAQVLPSMARILAKSSPC